MTILIPWSDIVDTAVVHLSSIDHVMADAIARVGPCTLAPNPNVFETLVDARAQHLVVDRPVAGRERRVAAGQ